MNVPVSILGRSFRLIFAQPLETLKVIAPGIIAAGLASILVMMALVLWIVSDERSLLGYTALALLVALGVIVGLAGIVAFAVLWHRHALLDDTARDSVMRPAGHILSRYLGEAVLVLMITFAAAFPVGSIFGIVIAVMDHQGLETKTAEILITIPLTVFLLWVAIRVSLTLPAASIGQKLSISESWVATGKISGDIFWTAVLLTIVNVTIFSLTNGLATALPKLEIAFSLLQIVIQSLIHISLLSTLYGHLIQGRSLT
ncbi:MAG: hypothetical protein R8G34_05680 [Paracoccaceae bacterium]|nr:hypothetical protein [Paracoccaceae bacterium]